MYVWRFSSLREVMSAHFAQARGCQLYPQDLQRILLLSSRIITSQLHTHNNNNNYAPDNIHTSPGASDNAATDDAKILLPAVVAGLLSEAHVRELIVHTLVRIAVPRNKQDALIAHNPYVQEQIHHAQQMQRNRASSSTPQSSMSHVHNQQQQGTRDSERADSATAVTHRVGRVTALLPKPDMTHKESTHHDAAAAASAKEATLLNAWLIAVHVGESVELLALRHVSPHAFTEEEYRVYLRSTLAALNRSPSTMGCADAAGRHRSGRAAALLLSAEEAEAKQATLQSLRTALHFIYTDSSRLTSRDAVTMTRVATSPVDDSTHHHVDTSHAVDAQLSLTRVATQAVGVWRSNGSAATAASAVACHDAVKRARSDDEQEQDEEEVDYNNNNAEDEKRAGPRSARHVKQEDDSAWAASIGRRPARSAAPQQQQQQQRTTAAASVEHDESAVWRQTVRDQRRQMQQLRALLHTREEELSQQQQAERQSTREHTQAVAQWRAKLEEESRTRARMQEEMNTTLQEQKTLLEQANTKLRRLAEMTTRYKRVADELRGRLEEALSAEGGGTAASTQLGTPEAILGALKQVKKMSM